jgi:uncharacterized membrane protein
MKYLYPITCILLIILAILDVYPEIVFIGLISLSVILMYYIFKDYFERFGR